MKFEQNNTIRLDKWLWAARFYKTRSLAREMIESGKVRYNNLRSKPSKIVEINAKITIRQSFDEKTVYVIALSDKRKSAKEAELLYKETEESKQNREKFAETRKLNIQSFVPNEQKPNKKERRKLIQFKQNFTKNLEN